jgi:hypothetical protein
MEHEAALVCEASVALDRMLGRQRQTLVIMTNPVKIVSWLK